MNSPSRAVREELEAILRDDASLLGEVFRRPNLGGRQIMEELGKNSSGFVANYRAVLAAIVEGDVDRAGPYAGQTRGAIRSMLHRPDLSEATTHHLESVLTQLPEGTGKAGIRKNEREASSLQIAAVGSLRVAVTNELVGRIRAMTIELRKLGVDADEYWTIATSGHPLDRLDELVLKEPRGRTFDALAAIGRLDLTLEAKLVGWAADLPFRSNLVDHARGRVDYYTR
ncbi:hypothetical protein V6K52_00460 [Knoellia sp. S7-12]|uniref:hypothetical protein n=1 Tax=Knoellia sp. S7-12 TaxID=3126698 RepID=UPI003368786C